MKRKNAVNDRHRNRARRQVARRISGIEPMTPLERSGLAYYLHVSSRGRVWPVRERVVTGRIPQIYKPKFVPWPKAPDSVSQALAEIRRERGVLVIGTAEPK